MPGTLTESGNIPFIRKTTVDVGALIQEKFGKPCVVYNDMEAALAIKRAHVEHGALIGAAELYARTPRQ